MSIATLTIDINARLASIEKDMGRAAHIAEANAKRMADAFSKVGDVFATIGAGATVAALGAIVKQTSDAADALGKLSQKTGITVENLSKLQYAASLSDVTNEDLAASLTKLSRAMADTAQGTGDARFAFAALGINVKTAAGNLKTTDQVFTEIAERLSGFKDSAEKTAIVMEIFGKNGASLIPILNLGKKGLADMGDEAARLGVVMSGTLAKASEEFNDNLTRLRALSSSVGIVIANSLIPAINDLSSEFLAAKTAGLGFFESLTSIGLSNPFKSAGQHISEINNELTKLRSGDGYENSMLGNHALDGAIARLEKLKTYYQQIQQSQTLADDSDNRDPRDRAAAAAAAMKQESAASKELREVLAAMQEAREKEARARAASSAAAKAEAEAVRRAKEQYKAFADAINRAFDESMAAAEADAELLKIAREGLDGLKDQVKTQQEYGEEIGKTGVALADLKAKRLEDAAAQNTQTAATLASIPGNEQQVEAYEEKARLLRELASLTRVNASKDATVQAAQDAAAEWERTSQQIENSLTDALMRGFENGEGFGENFRDTLIHMFKTLVLRPIIAPIAQGMAGGVMQMMGMSPQGGAGGMNLTGMASNAYSLYNNASIGYQFMTGGMSGANALGTMYANATGTGLDGLLATNGAYGTAAPAAGGMGSTMAGWGGAGLGAYAGYQLTGGNLGGAALGGVAGYGAASGIASGAGAYAGMTSSLAAIPVWGWAAIAALAIYSMTAKGGTPHVGSAVLTGLDDSQERLRHKQAVGDTVVWGGFKEGDGFTEPLKGLGKGVADTIEAALKDFGAGGSVSVYSAFGADGEDASRGNLRIYDAAGNLLAANSDQEKRGKKYDDDAKKGFEQFVADSGRVIRDALVAADLPAWVDEVLTSLGEGPSAEAVNTTLQQINDVKGLAALAGPALGLTAEGLAGVISASGDFTGTMNGIAAILGTTVDANDRWRMAQENLQKAFDAAGATLPASTEGFRAMLRGIDLTTDAGQSLYSNLLDLAPAFWQVASAVEGVFEQISKTTAATSEGFAFDVMDQQQRYGFFDSRITDTLAQLQSAIDPAAVLELFTKANEDLKSAWQLLDETEKRRLLPQFQDRAMELEAQSQGRLSVAPMDGAATQAAQIGTAVEQAVTNALTAVAETMAQAGGDQAAAAEMLAGAIAQIPARIVVEVEAAEVGGMGWR